VGHRYESSRVVSRFGSVRNCLDGIEALRTNGVRFLAVSQSIDTDESNPTARLLLHILASVAEFEREMIRERVCAGVKNAKAKGKQLGRKRVVFDRAKAREMNAGGASLRDIAAALQVGRGTVHVFCCPKNLPPKPPCNSFTMGRGTPGYVASHKVKIEGQIGLPFVPGKTVTLCSDGTKKEPRHYPATTNGKFRTDQVALRRANRSCRS
jgi:hypothetical protein